MDDTAHPVVEPYLTLLDLSKGIASHRHVSDLSRTGRPHCVGSWIFTISAWCSTTRRST
jgi:hypothetical protein